MAQGMSRGSQGTPGDREKKNINLVGFDGDLTWDFCKRIDLISGFAWGFNLRDFCVTRLSSH